MKKITLLVFFSYSVFFCVAPHAWADAFYCTTTNQYISQGMTFSAVKQACGEPVTIQKGEQPIMQRIPVQQLTFNIATSTAGNYQGTVTPGIQSSNIQINTAPLTTLIIEASNNRITDISLNGSSAQSVSICGGLSFGVGDSPASAIASCGAPASENDTYKNVPTGQQEPVEIWTYKPTNYQPPFQLVFVNGSLQNVDTSGVQ